MDFQHNYDCPLVGQPLVGSDACPCVKMLPDPGVEVFFTSKNTGPTWTGPDPISLCYIGTDLEKAIEAVGYFVRYEVDDINDCYYTSYPKSCSALPRDHERELVKYYTADGWWYTIEKIYIQSI
jgi:hypothetical protein